MTIHLLRERADAPLRVGLAGAGAMGRGIADAVCRTPGLTLAWVADLVPTRAADAAALGGAGVHGTQTLGLLVDHPVDVFVEATTAIGDAIAAARQALRTGAHVVWMNAEADLALGDLVAHEAAAAGLVATSDAGDQHGVLARLIDETELWGWKTVQAGNIKGFLDRSATPEGLRGEAAKRRLDPRACCAYTDGTKLEIEMALVANGRGLLAPEGGMRGPAAQEVSEALGAFDLEAALAAPEVDYLLGARPGGGVYVIGHAPDPESRFFLDYYKLGAGPFYLHYRPCHLCHFETPQAIAQAALQGRPILVPAPGPRQNEVFAVAKADLPAGTRIAHAIGSPLVRGELRRTANSETRVPVWLLHDEPGAVLRRSVSAGHWLEYADLDFADTTLLALAAEARRVCS